MKKKKFFLLTMILLLLILLTGCNESSNNSGNAPDFSLKTLDENTIKLSDYIGRIVLLDFMGVNCGYCVPQMITLEDIRHYYSENDLVIMTIDVWGDSAESVLALIEAYRCSSPCNMENTYSYLQIREYKSLAGKENGLELDWIFGLDSDSKIASKYMKPTDGVPKIVIIDKKGNIYYEKTGYTRYSEISEKINKII